MSDRLADYKKTGKDRQDKRREELLQDQERQRNELLDLHRQTIVVLSEQDDKKEEDLRGRSKASGRILGNMLMLSEWLVRPPEDMESSWSFMFCPEGRRCIVLARKGKTLAVTKGGKLLKLFQSALPGGRRGSARSATTLLDCIFSHNNESFYILDVLHWGEQPLVDTNTDFRHFWLESRIAEADTSTTVQSSSNNYPLVPLNMYSCTPAEFESRMMDFPYFEGNLPKVDGILFYHREALYSRGETPLVGWLKPFMLPEILGSGCTIANDYFLDRPDDYQDFSKYMADFDENLKLRKKPKKVVADVTMDESRFTEITDENCVEHEDAAKEDADSDPEERYKKLVEVEMED